MASFCCPELETFYQALAGGLAILANLRHAVSAGLFYPQAVPVQVVQAAAFAAQVVQAVALVVELEDARHLLVAQIQAGALAARAVAAESVYPLADALAAVVAFACCPEQRAALVLCGALLLVSLLLVFS